MRVLKIKPTISVKNFVLARTMIGYSQTELCKQIKGLSQPNLSKFESGLFGVIKEDKLREIMKFLDFPFEFLYKDEIKHTSNSWYF